MKKYIRFTENDKTEKEYLELIGKIKKYLINVGVHKDSISLGITGMLPGSLDHYSFLFHIPSYSVNNYFFLGLTLISNNKIINIGDKTAKKYFKLKGKYNKQFIIPEDLQLQNLKDLKQIVQIIIN